MKLLRVKIQNYKKHDSIELTFDEKLTLIGGPNEAGKSTIAEALHRVLFLKPKGTSVTIRQMYGKVSNGNPRIELDFKIGNQQYTLTKIFGNQGNTTLSSPQMNTVNGDEADQKLAELLSVDHGQTPANAIKEWGHLWARQGEAGADPKEMACIQQSKLISNLQSQGVAMVMQSDKDIAVVEEISKKFLESYTDKGKLRVGSKLKETENQKDVQYSILEAAEKKVKDLEQLSIAYANLESSIIDDSADLEILNKQKEELDRRKALLDELIKNFAKTKNIVTGQEETVRGLEAKLQKLIELHDEIKTLDTKLQPLKEKLDNNVSTKDNLTKSIKKIEDELLQKENAVNEGKQLLKYLSVYVQWNTTKKPIGKLKSEIEAYDENLNNIASLKNALAKIPQISQQNINQWNALESEVKTCQAILETISTEVEVIEAKDQITFDGELRSIGEKINLLSETVLLIGANTKLKIKPGGGNSLVKAKQELEEKQNNLMHFISDLGIKNKEDALSALENRIRLSADIERLEANFEYFNKESKSKELSSWEVKEVECKTTIERLQDELGDLEQKINLEDVSAALSSQEKICEGLEESYAHTKGLLKKEKDLLEDEGGEFQKINNEYQEASSSLIEKRTKSALLEDQDGNIDEREQKLALLKKDLNTNLGVLNDLDREINALSPSELGISIGRNTNSILSKTENLRESKIKQAELKGRLTYDGNQDPNLDLQKAFVTHQAIEAKYEGIKVETEAILLLNNLFQEEKEQLTKEFTEPFAKKINEYLVSVFGPGIKVLINSNAQGEFGGISIFRDQYNALGQMEFDILSGGTKEQVAAAVRLAMAEVLASSYEGSLPLIFDDAFVYSDADRINNVQNMLYKAAENGLQIIILSCNPRDYIGLGGKQISISSEVSFEEDSEALVLEI